MQSKKLSKLKSYIVFLLLPLIDLIKRFIMKETVEKVVAYTLMVAIGVMTLSAVFFNAPIAQVAFAVSMFCAAVCLFILVPMEVPEAQSWYEKYKDDDDTYLGL